MQEEANQVQPSSSGSKTWIWIIGIIIVLAIIGGAFFMFSPKGETQMDTSDAIQLTPTSSEAFNYFNLGVEIAPGVSGEIILNGKSLHKFTEEGGTLSSNEAQCEIKDGENILELRIDSVAEGTEPNLFSEHVIEMSLYAMNEPGFPSDEHILVKANWNPAQGKTSKTIKYKFNTLTTEETKKATYC